MRSKYTHILLICLSVITVCWLGIGTPLALAATTKAESSTKSTTSASNPTYGEALEIAPPVIYLTVNRGEIVSTKIYLRDVSSGPLLVSGQANDFVAAGEDGTPKILLGNQDANDPYSLKDWISPPPSLDLVPNEIKTMNIVMNVPANASPGGHYGVIRFTATPPSLKGTGVALSTSLGALLLVTVNGAIHDSLSVQQFSVSHNGKSGSVFQSSPLTFTEIFNNTGNVHEQPAGLVRVYDMFGRNLAALGINQPPANILPDSSRKFSQALDQAVIGNKRLFGKYRATTSVTYGVKTRETLTDSLTFWVIPYRLIAIVIILLVVLFFVLRFFIRRYNRHIIDRSGGNRQPPQPPQPRQ